MGGLLRRRRNIRAAGPLLEVLTKVGLVDHHAHGILRERPTLDEFRGLFSESPDPRQWPHVATGVTYRRAMRELADFFGCEHSEKAVYEHRASSDPAEYASSLLRATGTDLLFVDDGFPAPGAGTSWASSRAVRPCRCCGSSVMPRKSACKASTGWATRSRERARTASSP